MLLGYEGKNISLGPGQVLYQRRGAAFVTVTPAASPSPTTTTFSVVLATDMVAGAEKLRVGDVLQLSSVTTPLYTAAEFAALPRVKSLAVNGANVDVVVDKPFSGAPPTSAGSVRVLYKNLGATDGGIDISFDVQRSKQKIDQSPFTVAAPITDIEATLVAPLAEIKASHWALALGMVPGSSESAFSIGAAPDTSREDRLAIIFPAENGLSRYVITHRAQAEGKASIKASKTDKSLLELNLGLMPDTDFGAAALMDSVVAA